MTGVVPHRAVDPAPRAGAGRSIAILMCTRNGARYIQEQLESIAAQSLTDWRIVVSDDGSTDATVERIMSFDRSRLPGRISVRRGPQAGFSENFFSLIRARDIMGDYFALADQDDIWLPDKLERALEALETTPAGVPALYCSRTVLIDSRNCELGLSPLFRRTPDFRNALVQTLGGGNTMVFNASARELFLGVGERFRVPFHDWFLYLVISACGGTVVYDPRPSLRYRQHGANLMGRNRGVAARWTRLRMILDGRYRSWVDQNLKALELFRERLSPEHSQVLDDFAQWRSASLVERIRGLQRSRLYRQGRVETLALLLSVALRRI